MNLDQEPHDVEAAIHIHPIGTLALLLGNLEFLSVISFELTKIREVLEKMEARS